MDRTTSSNESWCCSRSQKVVLHLQWPVACPLCITMAGSCGERMFIRSLQSVGRGPTTNRPTWAMPTHWSLWHQRHSRPEEPLPGKALSVYRRQLRYEFQWEPIMGGGALSTQHCPQWQDTSWWVVGQQHLLTAEEAGKEQTKKAKLSTSYLDHNHSN